MSKRASSDRFPLLHLTLGASPSLVAQAKQHTSLSNTRLLQLIAGALVQTTGQVMGHERRFLERSNTKLLAIWAGALVDANTQEMLFPLGGGDPPIGGAGAPIGGGGWYTRLLGSFRWLRERVMVMFDY